ncbi:tyrosine-protein phosphatase [Flagellimonas nanhaiensis]|uniref:protein-tyrosine-phosphatase n=1 Tax=Flagellimonas nanhaiensis TaxID=2292706 RepID=A0A371JVW8_9FLAO|nr:CpsB/CapC family capsule biosynthesis tyrosine phosphatase [Allomuricauda nanhaiensis]RDY61971.1 histidinol phosphatase [Allomuricauda nanhaiensis]
MLHFFERKRFLIDYLHGLVDIHNHILPGIDDGAKTAEESIELIQQFSNYGIKSLICTPHIMHGYYDNTAKTIKNSFEILQKELASTALDSKIEYAAEHMIDDNFEALLDKKEVMPLKKDYLLIEMSYLQPSFNFDIAIEKIAKHSYFPILAHPERYIYFHKQYGTYSNLKTKGILFQLNLLSLGDYYGKEIQQVAEKLLKDKIVDYVGTDIHNMRQFSAIKELKISNNTLKLLLPIIENTILNFY